jgi:hypothetical protein
MKLQKNIIMSLIILILTLLTLNPGYAQIKMGQIVTFPGVVEQISIGFEFIVVNETKISLSSTTRIVDEKGNSLTLYDLKPRSPITIEVLKNANGFLAKNIIVKKQKR